jgi:arginyl-tRNA synthetase
LKAALIYFELSQAPASDYVFSPARSLAFKVEHSLHATTFLIPCMLAQGNTVVYLNYAYSRIHALERQCARLTPSSIASTPEAMYFPNSLLSLGLMLSARRIGTCSTHWKWIWP